MSNQWLIIIGQKWIRTPINVRLIVLSIVEYPNKNIRTRFFFLFFWGGWGEVPKKKYFIYIYIHTYMVSKIA